MKKAQLVLLASGVIFIATASVGCANALATSSTRSELPPTENVPVINGTGYSLDWLITEGEIVAYDTTMQSTDPTLSFNFGDVVADVTDDKLPDDLIQQLSDLDFSLPESGSMISILERNSHGNIAIKMIVHDLTMPDGRPDAALGEGLNQLMGAMVGTVQLRGELTSDGAIASFYLEQKQRNLLAIFFELPTRPVQVGDSWSIDVNCVEMGFGFIADNAERINRVEFAEVSETPDGRPIAVLNYLIAESVDGVFQSPFSADATPTSMTCSFIGRGEFLIDDGQWERFTGEFTIRATGLMEANSTQRFVLAARETVPPEYLELR